MFRSILTLGISIIWTIHCSATHLRAGEIRIETIDCESRLYRIIVIAYLDSQSGVPFGDGSLRLSDGMNYIVPQTTYSVVIDAARNVRRSSFEIHHQFSSDGTFTITYTESYRNAGILNMSNSVSTSFVLQSQITVSASGECNDNPVFLIPPVDRACQGLAFFHNPGASDPNGDSLSYSLIVPMRNGGEVANYRFPNDRSFYDQAGLNYERSNEAGDGPPDFYIDPTTGLLTWDAPGLIGEYVIAIKTTEWKYSPVDSTWHPIGYIIRDMQIIVESCGDQRRPYLEVPDLICTTPGNTIELDVVGHDPDSNPVRIEVFSAIFDLQDSPASISYNTLLQSSAPPNDTAHVLFRWQVDCSHVRDQYYEVVFKITDVPGNQIQLTSFRTLRIKVSGNSLVYEEVSLNPIDKRVTLQWQPYECPNTQSIQVWRRITRIGYDQTECAAGMPDFLRYKLIATLPASATEYLDHDINIGAQYCYRLVATIGSKNTQSKLSLDTCLIPKPAEAPVITNVSVIKTSNTLGEIEIKWIKPFDIDILQYPPPFEYEVYRRVGTGSFEKVSGRLSSTSFIDTEINTLERIHSYRIVLYVPALTNSPVDTSATAASVRLESLPDFNSIMLHWVDDVPWYNYVEKYSSHYIYRSSTGYGGPYQLIDSVDVLKNDFRYADTGVFMNQPLGSGQTYYYKVLTQGAYGNPSIPEPLHNFSQSIRTATLDTIPPCEPILVLNNTDCDDFPCNGPYTNELKWSVPQCDDESLRFALFASDSLNGNYVKLGELMNQFEFLDKDLPKRSRCYKVIAIDEAGNYSKPSETVCPQNCFSFVLPNVITPSRQDGCNDAFQPFSSQLTNDCGVTDGCLGDFISANISLYNVWGTLVYNSPITPESPIIWSEATHDGLKLSSGIYYYLADVAFKQTSDKIAHRLVKGWVHIVK